MKELAHKILEHLAELRARAQADCVCERKSVGCSIVQFLPNGTIQEEVFEHNGPSRPGHKCTNVVGNCGCSHAEPRAILSWLKLDIQFKRLYASGPKILMSTYSPCTNCANIILDSGVVDAFIFEQFTTHDLRGMEYLQAGLKHIPLLDLQILTGQYNPSNYDAAGKQREIAAVLAELVSS